MRKAYDYLLVGQGLAGTSLASHLMEQGASVVIMDDGRMESSSRVAAGLFNPVTGRKMVRTWMAEELFPYLLEYYRKMEALTGLNFLHEIPIYRPFLSVEEQNEWMGKSATPEFTHFVDKVFHGKTMSGVRDTFGGIMLKSAGYLDIPVYLDAMEKHFHNKGMLISETFRTDKLTKRDGFCDYEGFRAGKVIFCDGTSAATDTIFSWLPFRPVKGELLEVELKAKFPAIINRGVFVIEIGDGVFRAGSTYDNRQPDWTPSSAGREYILEKLRNLVEGEPRIRRHYAGVRPATADRRPVIGIHPGQHGTGIFNGLGTKGVSLSPWFGKHFAEHLTMKKPLLADVDISRYFSLY